MTTRHRDVAEQVRMREACAEDADAVARIRTRAFVDDPIKDWVSFSNESLFAPRWQHMFLTNAYTTQVVTAPRAVAQSLDGTPDYDLDADLHTLQDSTDDGRIIVGFTMYQYKVDKALQPARETTVAPPPPWQDELEPEARRRFEIVVKAMGAGLERNMSAHVVHERSVRRRLGTAGSSTASASVSAPTTRGTETTTLSPPSTSGSTAPSHGIDGGTDSAGQGKDDGKDEAATDAEPWIYVQYVGVHPLVSRRGVGGKLLKHIQSLADALPCQAYLESSAVGLPFYLAKGFTNLSDQGGDVVLSDPEKKAPEKRVPCLVYIPPPHGV